MTNKLEHLLREKAGGGPLYMCHLIAGFPTAKTSHDVALGLIEGGADILEIQVPFSDPMADGPAISVASREALEAGASVKKTLALAKKFSKAQTPVVLMSYLNPVYRYGIAAFARDAAKAGITGLIIPDAPFDSHEGQELIEEARKNGLCFIPVVSPGVPRERLQKLAKDASGFVYCTTRQGITGANSKFVTDIQSYMKSLREELPIPLGLGFGIHTKADAKRAGELADIVIAGSVFVHAIRNAKKGAARKAVAKALQTLRGTLTK